MFWFEPVPHQQAGSNRTAELQCCSQISTRANVDGLLILYELAVFVGSKGFRHLGEINQFMDLPHFRSTFVTCDGYRPFEGRIEYRSARLRKILPDFLSQTIVRRPYGPVSFVDFDGLENIPDFDIINTVELYSFVSRHCVALAHEKGARFCVSSWETIPSNPLFLSPPYLLNVRRVIDRADCFLVPTFIAANCLLRLGASRHRIRVTYPGIDLNEFVPASAGHDGFRILYVGRLDPEKGVHTLLESFVMLYSRNRDAELWLCGPTRTGNQFVSEVTNFARKYPIRLLGELPRKEIPSVYAQCDVFCLPSIDRTKWGFKVWEEQFGWSLVEAMASGLPIVASQCGAIQEVIGGHNIIVNQGSTLELFEAFLRLAVEKGLQIRIGQMNRERVEKYYNLHTQRLELDRVLIDLIGR